MTAAALNITTDAASEIGAVTSYTVSAVAVAHEALYVYIQLRDNDTNVPDAVAFKAAGGDVALKLIGTVNQFGSTSGSWWHTTTALSETADLEITFSGTLNTINAIAVLVIGVNGLDIASPNEGFVQDSGTGVSNIDVDVTTLGNDRLILAGGGVIGNPTITADSPTTLISTDGIGSASAAASRYTAPAATTQDVGFTFSAPVNSTISAFAVKPGAKSEAVPAPSAVSFSRRVEAMGY